MVRNLENVGSQISCFGDYAFANMRNLQCADLENKNCSKLGEYGSVIVQLKWTDTTENAYNFEITSTGTEQTNDILKGFVAYGYDSNGIFLQNSLSEKCGSLGFNFIKWDIFGKLFHSGSCFTI